MLGKEGTPPYLYSVDSQVFTTDNQHDFLPVGMHTVYVVDDNKCVFEDTFSIKAAEKLISSIPSKYYKEIGETITLAAQYEFDSTIKINDYRWEADLGLDCILCKETTFSGYVSEDVFLYTTYNEFCIDTLMTRVIVGSSEVYIPNSFNPLSDKYENSIFRGYAQHIRKYTMKVFDRWGEKIFHTDDKNIGWDGKFKGEMMPTGVYYYIARIELLNGEIIERKGTVNLLY